MRKCRRVSWFGWWVVVGEDEGSGVVMKSRATIGESVTGRARTPGIGGSKGAHDLTAIANLSTSASES